MKIEDLKYGKKDGTRKWQITEKKKLSPVVHSETTNAPDLPSAYTKHEGKVGIRIIFVLSGGEKRERDYFKMLRDDHKVERIKIAFASKKGQGLNPVQLFEEASKAVETKEFHTDEGMYHFEEESGDVIYLLQDIDEYEDEIRRLANIDQNMRLHWICSNPAFEIWLFYHYFECPLPTLDDAVSKTQAERSKWLKHHLSKIVKGGINPTKAITEIRTAIRNSKSNYAEQDGLPTLFSTQMFILAENILNVMGNEFNQMIERKIAFNKAMIKHYSEPIFQRYDGVKIQKLIGGIRNWGNKNKLMLPSATDRVLCACQIDDKTFSKSFKTKKAYLSDGYVEQLPVNTDELFMANIYQEIYDYYNLQFLLNEPIESYTIDFSEIKNVMDKLNLNGEYAVLSSFCLDSFDAFYGGEPLKKTPWGYQYKDVPIYRTNDTGRYMIIMHREYLPSVEIKEYEETNPEFELVDSKNMVYSNIHRMKDLDDNFGLSVIKIARFLYPVKGNFRFLWLNIVDHEKGKSEIDKLTKSIVVRLQYQEGDFVIYKDKIHEISEIATDGRIRLNDFDGYLYTNEFRPVAVDGKEDSCIYYEPVVAASTIRQSDEAPVRNTDCLYYLDSFKKSNCEDGESLFDKVSACHFRYVHELQHWLVEIEGQSDLKIRYSNSFHYDEHA